MLMQENLIKCNEAQKYIKSEKNLLRRISEKGGERIKNIIHIYIYTFMNE